VVCLCRFSFSCSFVCTVEDIHRTRYVHRRFLTTSPSRPRRRHTILVERSSRTSFLASACVLSSLQSGGSHDPCTSRPSLQRNVRYSAGTCYNRNPATRKLWCLALQTEGVWWLIRGLFQISKWLCARPLAPVKRALSHKHGPYLPDSLYKTTASATPSLSYSLAASTRTLSFQPSCHSFSQPTASIHSFYIRPGRIPAFNHFKHATTK